MILYSYWHLLVSGHPCWHLPDSLFFSVLTFPVHGPGKTGKLLAAPLSLSFSPHRNVRMPLSLLLEARKLVEQHYAHAALTWSLVSSFTLSAVMLVKMWGGKQWEACCLHLGKEAQSSFARIPTLLGQLKMSGWQISYFDHHYIIFF